jgi:two-component system sensor histidine kinase YesM
LKKLYTLKSKLIVYFSVLLFVTSFTICIYYSVYMRNTTEEDLIKNSLNNAEYMLSNVDNVLLKCENFSDWIFLNRSFSNVLLRDYSNPIFNYNSEVFKAKNDLMLGIASTSVKNYITGIILHGDNGVKIKYGVDADYIHIPSLEDMEWFAFGKDKAAVYWHGIKKNVATKTSDKYVIPLVRSIVFIDTNKQVGWQYINFSPSLISDTLNEYKVSSGDYIFLLDSDMQCVYASTPNYVGRDMSSLSEIVGKEQNFSMYNFNGEKMQAVYAKSEYSGFSLIYMLNYKVIQEQNTTITRMMFVIIAITITISLLMTLFLTTNLTNPLSKVISRVKGIALQEYDPVPEIEGEDEIGILGKEINILGSRVKQLINDAKENEKAKKDLEFKVLQNQINPHFIYNVLNSVKIMSEVQKSDGIYNTVTALGELLRETSKGTSDEITIRQELYLIEKYVDIQKIRKMGLIRVEYQVDENILDCKILKFLLQPIVENSITHGLCDKKGMGIIIISADDIKEDLIEISVTDNGIGMSQERLDQIMLSDAGSRPVSKYSSIGLLNVSDRIKLTYGEQYGLEITSVENKYTKVTITIPKRR